MSTENNVKDAEQLREEEAALERQLAAIRKKRIAAERKSSGASGPRQPLRETVLDFLFDADFPLNSLLIAAVASPLLGKDLTSNRFGTLSNDEAKSYDSSRVRPVYLCHLLNAEGGEAIKRYWARSDWPLERRVLGPLSSRVLFLKGADWCSRLAANEENVSDPEKLRFVAADQARHAGLPVKRGEFPFAEWRSAIANELSKYEEQDAVTRKVAAERLEKELSDRELLFGATPGLISIPGTNDSWRKVGE